MATRTANIVVCVVHCDDDFDGFTFGYVSRGRSLYVLDATEQPPNNRPCVAAQPGGLVFFSGVQIDPGIDGRFEVLAKSPIGKLFGAGSAFTRTTDPKAPYVFEIKARLADTNVQRWFHDDLRTSSATGTGKVAGSGEVSVGRGPLEAKLDASGERTWSDPSSNNRYESSGSDSFVRHQVTGVEVRGRFGVPRDYGALDPAMMVSRFG